MRTVKEVSKLTGVSVRTLHYYDAIGLLEPTKVTDAGYRMYDDTSLSRLQNILLFRELQFPLKEIKEILDSPNFNQEEAIAQQIKLLELQYKHIGEIISFARQIVQNVIMTVPFGFLYPLCRRVVGKKCGLLRCVLMTIVLSLSIEILQPLINGARSADITDVITNTVGGLIGYVAYMLFKPICRRFFE